MASKKKTWVMITKRTNDPKLSDFKERLDRAGIKHRENGRSFHAPILEVLQEDEAKAFNILIQRVGRRIYDDIPDDDLIFLGRF